MIQTRLCLTKTHKNRVGFVSCQILSAIFLWTGSLGIYKGKKSKGGRSILRSTSSGHGTGETSRAVHGTREYQTDPKNRTEIIPN